MSRRMPGYTKAKALAQTSGAPSKLGHDVFEEAVDAVMSETGLERRQIKRVLLLFFRHFFARVCSGRLGGIPRVGLFHVSYDGRPQRPGRLNRYFRFRASTTLRLMIRELGYRTPSERDMVAAAAYNYYSMTSVTPYLRGGITSSRLFDREQRRIEKEKPKCPTSVSSTLHEPPPRAPRPRRSAGLSSKTLPP